MSKLPVGDTYAVWSTAWGPMGAVAAGRTIVRTVLPHYQPDDLHQLLAFEHPGASQHPAAFAELIELSQAYFNAQPSSFASIEVHLPSPKGFTARVLGACREIPYGQTRSYREVAMAAGNPEGARAAAAALGKNPLPLVIPCHRVIYADGRLGGFSAPAGPDQKRRLLALEGAV